MATDLDGDMTPVRIKDMKCVVIHVGHRLLSLDVVIGTIVPHRCLRSTDQDKKQPLDDLSFGQMLLRNVVLAISRQTVDDGYVVRFRIAANATPETASHPHQMGTLSSVSSEPVSARHHRRKPPESCAIRK